MENNQFCFLFRKRLFISFQEPSVQFLGIDVIGTFWRVTTRELAHNLNRKKQDDTKIHI